MFFYILYRVSQEECARLRESVLYVKIMWDTTCHGSRVFLNVLCIQQICNTGHNMTKHSTCMNVKMLQHHSVVLITLPFPPSPNWKIVTLLAINVEVLTRWMAYKKPTTVIMSKFHLKLSTLIIHAEWRFREKFQLPVKQKKDVCTVLQYLCQNNWRQKKTVMLCTQTCEHCPFPILVTRFKSNK